MLDGCCPSNFRILFENSSCSSLLQSSIFFQKVVAIQNLFFLTVKLNLIPLQQQA